LILCWPLLAHKSIQPTIFYFKKSLDDLSTLHQDASVLSTWSIGLALNESNAGSTSRVNIVEDIIPPITTVARGR